VFKLDTIEKCWPFIALLSVTLSTVIPKQTVQG